MKCKKRFTLMVAVMMIMAILCACDVYSGGTKTEGNFTYRFNEGKKRAMVSSWKWDGDLNNTVIEIPDELDSAKIDALGGATGTNAPIDPFEIETDYTISFLFNGPDKFYGDNISFEDVVFTLKIGKNVKNIRTAYTNRDDDIRNYAPIQKEDGSWVIYRIYFEVVVDEENKSLYSENGKVSAKSGSPTIDLLPYLEKESAASG